MKPKPKRHLKKFVVTSGCRHPELPTRLRGLLVGTTWEVVFSVGGAA